MPLLARPVETQFAFPGGSEVIRIAYELGHLGIFLCGTQSQETAQVQFAVVEAFRVMDERDLLEYWPTCSTPYGWLFEIQGGGWLSQELERPGSLVGQMNRGLKEFLVTGIDDCVSILSMVEPEVLKCEP